MNKKKLYLANPYGFSKQTKNLLTEFIKIFQNLNVEVYEPFERTKHLITNKNNWAYDLAKANFNPTIIGHIMGTSKSLPPLEMILLIFFGLAFYLIDSIKRKLWVYIISNSIGFASQLTLLTIYTFGG